LPANQKQSAGVLPQASITIVDRSVLKNYFELIKPRITLLVVISTAVGYCFGIQEHLKLFTLLNTLFATALLAGGAATLNQWYERDVDSKMNRTTRRPIPAGSISVNSALTFGIALSIVATVDLLIFTNWLAVLLGCLTSILYLFIYTPLKRVGPICTTVGAIPGAMPPLIGFAAANGHLTVEAWILFGMIFLWQFPHFHAIAWIYRDDYARGGIKMLAVAQPEGKALSRQILLTQMLLIPITVAPVLVGMAGTVYAIAALLLGIGFLVFGLEMCSRRDYTHARRLLLSSVIYLPLLFVFLVMDNLRFPIWH
jgi:protoheme IX farnesyltransferase